MQDHPQYIVKKEEAKWEVLGVPPPLHHASENKYRTFLSCVKQALKSCQHEWSRLPLIELQKQQQIKELYEHYFKNNPVTPQSVMAEVGKLQKSGGRQALIAQRESQGGL